MVFNIGKRCLFLSSELQNGQKPRKLRHFENKLQRTIEYEVSQRPTLKSESSNARCIFFADAETLFLSLLQSAAVVCLETSQRHLKDRM